MKKSVRAELYDRIIPLLEASDQERKETRQRIDQLSDEELPALRQVVKALEHAYEIIENAKLRNVLRRKSWREESIRFLARCASRDLKASRSLISEAAGKEDKLFFITLGKCLSGEIKDDDGKLNLNVAWIVSENPSISAKEAVHTLKQRPWMDAHRRPFSGDKKAIRAQ